MAKPIDKVTDGLLLRVAELFLEGKSATEIRDIVNREYSPEQKLSRQSAYPLLAKAMDRGFVKLVPPVERRLTELVTQKFKCDPGTVLVVNTPNKSSNYLVAAAGAKFALDLIKDIAARKSGYVGLGLGPGRATYDFSEHLGQLMKSEVGAPKLNLLAISAGCPSRYPQYAPTSFFNLFPPHLINEQVGLFAQTLVRNDEFDKVKDQPGVREVFEYKYRDEIDLVATSMGDASDQHDLLGMFLREAKLDTNQLQKEGWVGNVQYRPYSSKGPIKEAPTMLRAVTLFELHELKQLAERRRRHVILMARQCGICGRTRAFALKPVLTVPELRVFSRLVLDVATATDLIR